MGEKKKKNNNNINKNNGVEGGRHKLWGKRKRRGFTRDEKTED